MNPRVIQWRVRASTEALQRASDDETTAPLHPHGASCAGSQNRETDEEQP